MRLVVVGEGEDGRSTVVEVKELFEGDSPGSEVLWATHESPPEIPVPRRNPKVDGVEVRSAGTEPGGSRWFLVSRPPGGESGMHRGDAINYVATLAGGMTLELEDGEITLGPGDAVVVPGVAHNWRYGSEGCIYTVVLLGLAPPE
jgi:quercetin dioxygenase-like cupin family protein